MVDTSCLLRLPNAADPRRTRTLEAFEALRARNESLIIAEQNCTEFRNVISRPVAVNGMGLTPEQADRQLDDLEQNFRLLPDPPGVYAAWRDLCRRAGVSGKQVHDTRLVAVCVAAGMGTILTWNPADFRRFLPLVPGLSILTPDDVMAP